MIKIQNINHFRLGFLVIVNVFLVTLISGAEENKNIILPIPTENLINTDVINHDKNNIILPEETQNLLDDSLNLRTLNEENNFVVKENKDKSDKISVILETKQPQEIIKVSEKAISNNENLNNKSKTINAEADKKVDFDKQLSFDDTQDINLWKYVSSLGFFFALLGVGSYFMLKFKKNNNFLNPKSDKPLQIIYSLSLSPKRQILLLKIREQEVLVSSTEQGITFLSDIKTNYLHVDNNAKKVQSIEQLIPQLEIAKVEQSEHREGKKSNLLHTLKEYNDTKDIHDKEITLNIPKKPQTQTTVPRYLANNFNQELANTKTPITTNNKDKEEDSVESVTKMIREKLKSMQSS